MLKHNLIAGSLVVTLMLLTARAVMLARPGQAAEQTLALCAAHNKLPLTSLAEIQRHV